MLAIAKPMLMTSATWRTSTLLVASAVTHAFCVIFSARATPWVFASPSLTLPVLLTPPDSSSSSASSPSPAMPPTELLPPEFADALPLVQTVASLCCSAALVEDSLETGDEQPSGSSDSEAGARRRRVRRRGRVSRRVLRSGRRLSRGRRLSGRRRLSRGRRLSGRRRLSRGRRLSGRGRLSRVGREGGLRSRGGLGRRSVESTCAEVAGATAKNKRSADRRATTNRRPLAG